jgi:hypothetical protein
MTTAQTMKGPASADLPVCEKVPPGSRPCWSNNVPRRLELDARKTATSTHNFSAFGAAEVRRRRRARLPPHPLTTVYHMLKDETRFFRISVPTISVAARRNRGPSVLSLS